MLEIKNVKKIQIRRSRFGYESESEYYSSCKNHESESEYSGFGGKDSNPNPNPNISDLSDVLYLTSRKFDVTYKGLRPYYVIIFWGVLPPLVVK